VSEADDKKTLLVGLFAFVNEKPPPLEDITTKGTPTEVKVEPANPTEKASVDVSKVLRPAFKIHGVVGKADRIWDKGVL